MAAASHGHPAVAKLLLRNGADIDQRDEVSFDLDPDLFVTLLSSMGKLRS